MSSISPDAMIQMNEALAARVVATDAEDLTGLSGIHDDLQELFGALDGSDHTSAREVAARATGLVEQIVMREVEDADESLRRVGELVSSLQTMLREALTGSASAPGSVGADTAAGSATALPVSAPTGGDGLGELSQIDAPIKSDDLPLLKEFVAEAREHLETAEAQLLKLEEVPGDIEAINAVFRSFHTIKGVAGFLNLRQIGALAHWAETVLDKVRQSRLRFTEARADVILQSADLMKSLIGAAEVAGDAGQSIPADPRLPRMIRRLDECQNEEAAVVGAEDLAQASAAAHVADQGETSATPARAGTHTDATVKIATGRLDALINTVGELVIAQAMVAQDLSNPVSDSARLSRDTAHVSKIVRELQDLSMAMRMVPVQGLFQKMGRLVRDLCKKLDKEIDLVLSGGETELDRNVVEVLGDPLMHMVRNAGDHGIEMPDDRVRCGKPRHGRLELRARHEAGAIVIEIIDDGKGLNKERIVKKAIAAGIMAEGEAPGEQEIHRLIFHAGLSTAEKVTDVSGRGVGMDVVKKNIEALRGRIDVASAEGKGSVFTIRLPLTMAVIDGLVARVGTQRYIIPTTSIEQSLRPTREQLSSVQGRGEVCLVRGEVLSMFRLHRLFSLAGAVEDPAEGLVVIVRDNGRRCCLVVDELLGQQQVVIKSLGEGIGSVPGVSGGAILGDGNVSLILDVHGLIDVASIHGDNLTDSTSFSKEQA